MRITLNKNREIVERVNKALDKKQKKYGFRYCPCILPSVHDDCHICPCKEFVEGPVGTCHCGKYIKTN